jgi:hypothetical protein
MILKNRPDEPHEEGSDRLAGGCYLFHDLVNRVLPVLQPVADHAYQAKRL